MSCHRARGPRDGAPSTGTRRDCSDTEGHSSNSSSAGTETSSATARYNGQTAADLTGVTRVSDGYVPFCDNADYAAEHGVTTLIEPGGSTRTPEVEAAAHAVQRTRQSSLE
ncbi:hypothetical protein [Curtobacterium sp. ISL-83]|uniref:hypothetical protein n=1 Tax=Curtobacterium sp. ISL-83 TaxID=2819145 RepID=UPI001BE5511A|nr:hypothetical protein [Curtobacterium sp. ISL-83]MBT2504242.1 hypothetical protein [Curtobacterium sp. ISL-83]